MKRRLRSGFRPLVSVALFLLLGWFVGQAVASAILDASGEGTLAEAIVLVPVLALGLLLALAVHEAGHLLGGWSAGFQPLLFVVGPLKVERRRDGWAFRFNRTLALWGGLAASAPTDTRELRSRSLRMVAGGPLTSLAVGSLGLLLWGLIPLPPPEPVSVMGVLSLGSVLLSTGSLAIGIITLVPARTAGFHTDGGQILRYLRGGSEAEAHAALHTLVGLSMGGTRPRDWPSTLVKRVRDFPADDAAGLAFLQLAFLHALDREEVPEARRLMESALARREVLPAPLRTGLLAHAAYFAAIHDGDPIRARRLLGEMSGRGFAPEHQPVLAEAAVHYVEGDDERARQLAAVARTELATAMDLGTGEAEAEWLDGLMVPR